MPYSAANEGSLFEHLLRAFPDSSRSTLRSWVAHGRILVNGRRTTRTDVRIAAGATVELARKPLPKIGPLRIHYEDRDIIVVEKPSGLLSVDKDEGEEPSVHAWLKHQYPGRVIPVVHRLDQDTSGLMVFGLSEEGFRGLKAALQRRDVKRIYRAVVEGQLLQGGTWDTFLIEDRYLVMQVVKNTVSGAERAITHYSVLQVGQVYTLIDCELETGKKNQIRVQAAHAGHPLAGDTKYGCVEKDANRLCLHARLLSFPHPVTGAFMTFESPPPPFFNRLIWKKK